MGAAWIELWDAFGAGVYLFFCIIHLDLFLRRRDRRAYLFVAMASAGAFVVDLTGMASRRLGEDFPPLLAALNLLGVAVATVFLFELVSELGRRPPGRTTRGVEGLFLAAPAVLPLVPPLQPLFLLWAMGFLLISTAMAFRAARRGDAESGKVAKGFVVLMAVLVADLLGELHLLSVPSGLPILGFIVLFLASAFSLNDRFEREEAASRTDALTGLKNRRGFLEAADDALRRARRSGLPLSVILGDLDHFKRVNDEKGHRAGDEVLEQVAHIFATSLREQDTAGRWGGEEFVVLLPDTPLAGALTAAENLRRGVASLQVQARGVPLTLSLGVAEHLPENGIEETIARADAALYRAKEEGRNRVNSASPCSGEAAAPPPQARSFLPRG